MNSSLVSYHTLLHKPSHYLRENTTAEDGNNSVKLREQGKREGQGEKRQWKQWNKATYLFCTSFSVWHQLLRHLFFRLSASAVLGQSYYFGFVFMVLRCLLNRKVFYYALWVVKKHASFSQQMRSGTKTQSWTCSHAFYRTCCWSRVFVSSSDWFIWLFASVVLARVIAQ